MYFKLLKLNMDKFVIKRLSSSIADFQLIQTNKEVSSFVIKVYSYNYISLLYFRIKFLDKNEFVPRKIIKIILKLQK